MGLLAPGQNFDHLLDAISGYNGMHDLQLAAVPATGQTFNRGALVSLDASGNLIAGLSAVDGAEMPLWAINAAEDLDANSDPDNISGAKDRQDGKLLGGVGTFVATGGYELATTEFDIAALASYVPNAPLIHDTGTAGFVTAGTSPIVIEESVVGIVSKGVRTEVYNQKVLQFWPVFLPARVITP